MTCPLPGPAHAGRPVVRHPVPGACGRGVPVPAQPLHTRPLHGHAATNPHHARAANDGRLPGSGYSYRS